MLEMNMYHVHDASDEVGKKTVPTKKLKQKSREHANSEMSGRIEKGQERFYEAEQNYCHPL